MKLIFIYGAPAVGKLTVATELARLTGFKLFDNHVSIRFVESLFEFGTRKFLMLIEKFRKTMFEEAAREGVDTIFTFVYQRKVDDLFVRRTVETIRSHGGRVCFVRLFCDEAEMMRRVGTVTRKRNGKLGTKKKLQELLRSHDLGAVIPYQSSLSIDTSELSPRVVAKMIVDHYGLHGPRRNSARSG